METKPAMEAKPGTNRGRGWRGVETQLQFLSTRDLHKMALDHGWAKLSADRAELIEFLVEAIPAKFR